MTTRMHPAPTTTRRLRRPIARALAPLAMAAAVLAVAAAPAEAAVELPGQAVTVSAHVVCDYANHRLLVTPEASVAAPFDRGIFIRYNVWWREAGQVAWQPMYSWSPWVSATPTITRTDIVVIDNSVELGAAPLYVTQGHDYEVIVQVDFWTGVSNSLDVWPTYGVVTDGTIGTYTLSPGVCRM